jgi:hypothetical protein
MSYFGVARYTTNPLSNALDANQYKITNLATGTSQKDAVNVSQISHLASNPLNSALNANNFKITNLATGTDPTDAVNLWQLETLASGTRLFTVSLNQTNLPMQIPANTSYKQELVVSTDFIHILNNNSTVQALISFFVAILPTNEFVSNVSYSVAVAGNDVPINASTAQTFSSSNNMAPQIYGGLVLQFDKSLHWTSQSTKLVLTIANTNTFPIDINNLSGSMYISLLHGTNLMGVGAVDVYTNLQTRIDTLETVVAKLDSYCSALNDAIYVEDATYP